MRNYKTTFADEEVNTQHFLSKLEKFKTASKDLKKKNTLAQHRHEWQKEYQRLKDLEIKQSNELISITQIFDNQYGDILEENQYNVLADQFDQQQEFQNNLWKQLKNIKQVVPKLNETNIQDFIPLYEDLKKQFKPDQVPPLQNPFDQEIDEEFDLMIHESDLLEDQDQGILQQYEYALSLIDQTYELSKEKIEQECYHPINKNFENKEQYDQFRHIFNTYIKKGKDREFYYERLKMIFDCSRKHLEDQTNFFQMQQLIKQKKKGAFQDTLRQKQAIKLKTEQEIRRLVNKRIEDTKNDQEKLQLQMKLFEQEYEIRKDIYMQKQLEQKVIDDQVKKENEQQEKMKQEKLNVYYNKQKDLSQQYKNQKEIRKQNQILEQQVNLQISSLLKR